MREVGLRGLRLVVGVEVRADIPTVQMVARQTER